MRSHLELVISLAINILIWNRIANAFVSILKFILPDQILNSFLQKLIIPVYPLIINGYLRFTDIFLVLVKTPRFWNKNPQHFFLIINNN